MFEYNKFYEQQADIVCKCIHKNPIKFTEEEKVALAIIAGCEMEYTHNDNGIMVKSKNKICFQKINGKLVVFQSPSKIEN